MSDETSTSERARELAGKLAWLLVKRDALDDAVTAAQVAFEEAVQVAPGPASESHYVAQQAAHTAARIAACAEERHAAADQAAEELRDALTADSGIDPANVEQLVLLGSRRGSSDTGLANTKHVELAGAAHSLRREWEEDEANLCGHIAAFLAYAAELEPRVALKAIAAADALIDAHRRYGYTDHRTVRLKGALRKQLAADGLPIEEHFELAEHPDRLLS